MKHILSVLLVIVLLMALAAPALAQESPQQESPQQESARQESAQQEDENSGRDETKPEKDTGDREKPKAPNRSAATATGKGTVNSGSNSFMLARDARQTSRTEGDIAALGDDTEITRGVGGNIYTAGRNVMISDEQQLQSIVAAGVNVSIHVKKAENIYAAGGDINVHADDGAEGVYLAGATVTLSGKVRDGYIAAATVNLSGSVAENLTIRSDNIMFSPDTTVGGEITVVSNARPNLPASIDPAKVKYRAPGAAGETGEGDIRWQAAFRRIAVAVLVSGMVAAVIVSLALNAARGGFFRDRADKLRRYFWRDMLRGFAGLIVLPVLAVLLMVTVIGIPIGAVLLALTGVCVYLSPIVAGLVFGNAIFPRMNRFLSGAITVLAIWLLMLVPYLGIAVTLFSTIYGAGAIISAVPPRHRRDRRKRGEDDSHGEHAHAHA